MVVYEDKSVLSNEDSMEEVSKILNYKENFRLEYLMLKENYNKLHRFIVKYEAGTLDCEPNCSLEILKKQASAMGQYLYILEIRAELEDIDILERTIKGE